MLKSAKVKSEKYRMDFQTIPIAYIRIKISVKSGVCAFDKEKMKMCGKKSFTRSPQRRWYAYIERMKWYPL